MDKLYTKARFNSMVHNYKCIIQDRDEEIKSYRLQLEDVKRQIDEMVDYGVDKQKLLQLQEELHLYT